MKILHLSGTYVDDGASISIINLNKSLNKSEFKSKIFLLKSKTKSLDNIYFLNLNLVSKIKFYVLSKIEYFFISNITFYITFILKKLKWRI